MIFDFILKKYKNKAKLSRIEKILLIIYSISGVCGLVTIIAYSIIDMWGNDFLKGIEPYIFYFSIGCFLILFIIILLMLIYQDKRTIHEQSQTAMELIKKRFEATDTFLSDMGLANNAKFNNNVANDFYLDALIKECDNRISEIKSTKSELSKIIANTLKVFVVPVITGSTMDYSLKNALVFKDNPGLIAILIVCYIIIVVSLLILCKMIEKAINEKKMKEVYDIQRFKYDLELYKTFRETVSE